MPALLASADVLLQFCLRIAIYVYPIPKCLCSYVAIDLNLWKLARVSDAGSKLPTTTQILRVISVARHKHNK